MDLEELADISDPLTRALRAGELMEGYQNAISDVSQLRLIALEELLANGATRSEIAKSLGLTRARVGRILASGATAERSILGTGKLTVALGGKSEANKDNPGVVVSDGAHAAYQLLVDLAQGFDLEAESEVIAPNGMIRLNRPNLIVICGPRLSPLLQQVLEVDRRYRFELGDDGNWFYRDLQTNETYHSPMNDGGTGDLAYIARLPRPDGQGSFLYIAGLHAPGSVGAVHWLDANLTELYNDVKTKRFSLLISAEFDGPTTVMSSKALTDIHIHD